MRWSDQQPVSVQADSENSRRRRHETHCCAGCRPNSTIARRWLSLARHPSPSPGSWYRRVLWALQPQSGVKIGKVDAVRETNIGCWAGFFPKSLYLSVLVSDFHYHLLPNRSPRSQWPTAPARGMLHLSRQDGQLSGVACSGAFRTCSGNGDVWSLTILVFSRQGLW